MSRLLAPDVLLACLERQDESALAVQVGRLADDPARHPSDELLPGCEEAVVRAAVGEVVPGTLALADRDRATVRSGRLQNAEGERIDVGDRERLGVVGRRGQLGSRLETAEEVGLLEDDARGILRSAPELVRVRDAVAMRHLDDLEPEPRCVGLHDLPGLRIQRLGEDDLGPPR